MLAPRVSHFVRCRSSSFVGQAGNRAYSNLEKVRRHPSAKLKIDMLSTSLELCLHARRRKILRSVRLKLFSRYFHSANCLPNLKRIAASHHEALGGFCSASFGGGCKGGKESGGLLAS